jgi:hypothetical protein
MSRWLTLVLLAGVPASWAAAAEWKPHVVRQLNGAGQEICVPAKLQIVTEQWNRVAAVPYLVYMPEKDRLLMLVNRDYGPALKPVHCGRDPQPVLHRHRGLGRKRADCRSAGPHPGRIQPLRSDHLRQNQPRQPGGPHRLQR